MPVKIDRKTWNFAALAYQKVLRTWVTYLLLFISRCLISQQKLISQHIFIMSGNREPFPNGAQHKKFHEFLPNLISEISKTLATFHRILILKHKREDYLLNETIRTFQENLSGMLIAKGLKDEEIAKIHEVIPIGSNIFRRFTCRLVEVLLPFRQRTEASTPIFSYLIQVIKAIERAIYLLQEGINFDDFLELILNALTAFIENLNTSTTNQSSPTKPGNLINGNQTQKGAVVQLKENKTLPQAESGYQKQLRKMVHSLNIRFKTVGCLDLDYNHFRSSYFQAKNNEKSLYEDILIRNRNIQSQMLGYSKDFKEYLQKRERRRASKRINLMNTRCSAKREGFRNNRSSGNQNKFQNNFNSMKPDNWGTIRSSSQKKNFNRFSIINGKDEQLDSYFQSRKPQYQLKNIMITASNLQNSGMNEMTKMTITNTLRQLENTKKRATRHNDRTFLKNLRELGRRAKCSE